MKKILVVIIVVAGLPVRIGGVSNGKAGGSSEFPKLRWEKAGVGLKAEAGLYIVNEVGKEVMLRCTITNTSNVAKAITWAPLVGNFCFRKGDEIQPGYGGRSCVGYPLINKTPLMIKSWWAHQRRYILCLPPKGELTFVVHVGKADKIGEFKGRICYNPLPKSSQIAIGEQFRWEDHFVFSNVVSYQVVKSGSRK